MREEERRDGEGGEPTTDSGHGNNPLESAGGNESATSNGQSEEEEEDLFFPEDPSDLGLGESDSNSESEPATPEKYSEKKRDSAQVSETSHSEDAQEYVRQNYNPLATELPDSFSKSVVAPEVGFKNHGLSSQEAMFLRTVVDAYNGHNEYLLELPMSKHLIGPDDNINIEKLVDKEFIKWHYLLNKGHYYTPTPKAQRAVGRTLKSGERVGDIGEDMPHRVLVVLARKYFESLSNVHMVKCYRSIGSGENEGVIDVVAVDENHNPCMWPR